MAGEAAGVAGSTLQGAAAGSAFGPWGAAIGGGIGFITGLFSADAQSEQNRLEELQVERNKIAVGLEGEAREMQLALNALEVDRARKGISQNAFLAGEGVVAGASISGLVNSSIAKNARAGIGHQLASNLQHSYLTEDLGEQISQLRQDAIDAANGLNDPDPEPVVAPARPPKEDEPIASSRPDRDDSDSKRNEAGMATSSTNANDATTGDGGENVPLFDMSANAGNVGTQYVADDQYGAI